MLKIAFICVHNSCRSQMAEAIAKNFHSDEFEAYSAGTHVKDHINQDAVKIIKKLYDVEMDTYHSKLISEIPEVDIVITMGCNVDCPTLPCRYREDWGLDDPTGESEFVFELTAKLIAEKMDNLAYRIKLGVVL